MKNKAKNSFNPLILSGGLAVALLGLVALFFELWAFDTLTNFLAQIIPSVDGVISNKQLTGLHLYLNICVAVSVPLATTICACSWQKYRQEVTPYRVSLVLTLIVLLLASLSIAGQYQALILGQGRATYFYAYFNLDGERIIPTGFSAILLLSSASILAFISYRKQQEKAAYVKSWYFLALVFVYLSVDEANKIHEESLDFLSPLIGIEFLHFWVIPATVIVLIFVLSYSKFLMHLTSKYRKLFILSGAIYVGGAIGIETIGGLYAENYGKGNISYQIIADIEEMCEMMGIVLFIYTLQSYWIDIYKPASALLKSNVASNTEVNINP